MATRVLEVLRVTLPNHFDRSKPFYPIVMNYVMQLIGFKELALRGITGPPDDRVRLILQRFSLEKEAEQNKEALEKLRKGTHTLGGPLKLASVVPNNAITVDIDEIAQDIFENSSYLVRAMMLPAMGSIFIVAYETARDQGWRKMDDPLWEFLRHCRNAAAHDSRFTFYRDEPRRVARWRHLEIKRDMQDMPLFKDNEGIGFLLPGDPICLLWDLEQANLHMHA